MFPSGAEISAALYWRGRLAEEAGDPGSLALARACCKRLSERFRSFYYAELARERLRQIAPDGPVADEPALRAIPEAQLPVWAQEPPADNVRVARSRLLRNGGLNDLAVRELEAASAEGPAPWVPGEIARVYTEGGRHDRALQVLKRNVSGYFSLDLAALPRPIWEGLFPRPYWDDLKRNADENHLDPFLIASLIRQESEFNPAVISHANAWGLMQVLPVTGRKLARDLNLRNFTTDQLLLPGPNLQLGTRYFRDLLDQYGGQVEYALAAYNAVPDRVDAWRNNGKYRDMAEFVESIPFTETREYVQSVLRNVAVYRRLYGTP